MDRRGLILTDLATTLVMGELSANDFDSEVSMLYLGTTDNFDMKKEMIMVWSKEGKRISNQCNEINSLQLFPCRYGYYDHTGQLRIVNYTADPISGYHTDVDPALGPVAR